MRAPTTIGLFLPLIKPRRTFIDHNNNDTFDTCLQ